MDILKNFKNVQDGISRPLGSREIQKEKSGKSVAGHPVNYNQQLTNPTFCDENKMSPLKWDFSQS